MVLEIQAATPAGGTNGQNRTAENGITVGKPKQFDERTLTVMLQDLENKLTRSQFPDPTALNAATGRFAGATAATSSMALSVRGPSTPSIVSTVGSTDKQTSGTTSGEGTEQTETVGGTNPSKTDKETTSRGSTTSNETSNTNQQVTTQGSFAAPTATAPNQTSMFPFQPQFGISAQDLLAEQTSLFYQIANLRLLLDRSITDRVKIKNEGRTTTLETRDQVVVGFKSVSMPRIRMRSLKRKLLSLDQTSRSFRSCLKTRPTTLPRSPRIRRRSTWARSFSLLAWAQTSVRLRSHSIW